jgi:hypothetical protein
MTGRQTNDRSGFVRNGILKTEALLALVVLIAAINFASTLIHRINRLWMDAQGHQFAISELSNHMDGLTRLSPKQAETALESIAVSEACEETLPDAKLSGELLEDDLGTRVILKLSWSGRKFGEPLELSGWLAGREKSEANQ